MPTTVAFLGASLGFAFATWLSWIVFTALRSGVASIAGGKKFKRKNSPVAFWTTVFVQTAFTVMFLSAAIVRLCPITR